MDKTINSQRLHGKNVVVIGGSKGVGRVIVAATYAQGAQVLAVGRQEEPLNKLSDTFPGVRLDASNERAPAVVFATLSPDVLVVSAGAIPFPDSTLPLQFVSCENFTESYAVSRLADF